MRQPPELRERTEELERASLSIWATLAIETKGRDRHEDPDRLRTAFQVDRDRIVATPEFERLAGASQRLIGPGRSRLSHTVRVARIAQVIARGLRLNEDLTDAIALGQSLGGPPLGTAGTEGLRLAAEGGFEEGEQSVRVVELLAGGGRGLNLTWETRDGILQHGWNGAEPATAEGQTVRVSGRIATVHQLLRAAVEVGGVTPEDLEADGLSAAAAAWVDATIADVVATSLDRPEVRLSPRTAARCDELERLAAEALAREPDVRRQHRRAVHCMVSLVVYYRENPQELPPAPVVDRQVVDVLAGETDQGLRDRFTAHFLPDVSVS